MFGALVVSDFHLQAFLRGTPEMAEQAIALVSKLKMGGGAKLVSLSRPAWKMGIRPGQTVAQARAQMPELLVFQCNLGLEESALNALLQVAQSLSPRIQVPDPQKPGQVIFDAEGLEGLFGPPHLLARSALRRAERLGIQLRCGHARTCSLAMLAAKCTSELSPVQVIEPTPKAEAAFLGPLPLATLAPAAKLQTKFERFGLRTIGDLQRLPKGTVLERLGAEGQKVVEQAFGEDLLPFVPMAAALRFVEESQLESAIDNLESLAFVLKSLLDRVLKTLALHGYLAGSLRLEFGYDYGGGCVREVLHSAPSRDQHSLLSLCRLALEKDPPTEAVGHVKLEAQAIAPRKQQLELFEPVGPAPDKLAVTLARLEALCGKQRVGKAILEDSHVEDDFKMGDFDAIAKNMPKKACSIRVGLRRCRPPVAVEVLWSSGAPRVLEMPRQSLRVHTFFGPYRLDIEWWKGEIAQENRQVRSDIYDLFLDGGQACRVAFEHPKARWWLYGWYD